MFSNRFRIGVRVVLDLWLAALLLFDAFVLPIGVPLRIAIGRMRFRSGKLCDFWIVFPVAEPLSFLGFTQFLPGVIRVLNTTLAH